MIAGHPALIQTAEYSRTILVQLLHAAYSRTIPVQPGIADHTGLLVHEVDARVAVGHQIRVPTHLAE